MNGNEIDRKRQKFWERLRRWIPFAGSKRTVVREEARSARFGTVTYYWEQTKLESERKNQYDEYAALNCDMPEVSAALDTYADNSVAGTHGDSYEVNTEHSGAKFAFKMLEDLTGLKSDTWNTIRDLYLNGDRFVELVPNMSVRTIGQIVRVPPDTISYNLKGGVIEDPKETFKQSPKGIGQSAGEIYFSDKR